MEAAAAEADAATPEGREEEGATRDPEDGGDDLAADPEVARLLDELQDELDAGYCSDGSDSEEGGEEGEGGQDGEEETEREKEGEDEDEKDDCARNIETVAEKTMPDNKGPPPSPQRKEVPQPERASTGPSALPPPGVERCHQEGQGGIDISRMKIDAPHHTHWRRGGERPRSAPSACLSAGGFSKLSSRASSSSRIARTVSQKLLQATKEAEEQRAAEVSEAQGGRRSSAASAIAQADGRIDVVKQNAEALQVRGAPRDACVFCVVLLRAFLKKVNLERCRLCDQNFRINTGKLATGEATYRSLVLNEADVADFLILLLDYWAARTHPEIVRFWLVITAPAPCHLTRPRMARYNRQTKPLPCLVIHHRQVCR